jgi:hypothetical protein
MPRNSKIQIRRSPTTTVDDDVPGWQTVNPTLSVGELGLDIYTKELKVGTNYTPWNSLPAFTASGLATGTTLATTSGGTNRTDGAAPPFLYGHIGADTNIGSITGGSPGVYNYMFSATSGTSVGVTLASNTTYEIELLWMSSFTTGTTAGQFRWNYFVSGGGGNLTTLAGNAGGTIATFSSATSTVSAPDLAVGVAEGMSWQNAYPSSQTVFNQSRNTVAAIMAASTNYSIKIYTKSIFKVTTGGVFNPAFTHSGTVSLNNVTNKAGSFVKLTPLSSTATSDSTVIGSWT